jgi:hypothetical protein
LTTPLKISKVLKLDPLDLNAPIPSCEVEFPQHDDKFEYFNSAVYEVFQEVVRLRSHNYNISKLISLDNLLIIVLYFLMNWIGTYSGRNTSVVTLFLLQFIRFNNIDLSSVKMKIFCVFSCLGLFIAGSLLQFSLNSYVTYFVHGIYFDDIFSNYIQSHLHFKVSILSMVIYMLISKIVNRIYILIPIFSRVHLKKFYDNQLAISDHERSIKLSFNDMVDVLENSDDRCVHRTIIIDPRITGYMFDSTIYKNVDMRSHIHGTGDMRRTDPGYSVMTSEEIHIYPTIRQRVNHLDSYMVSWLVFFGFEWVYSLFSVRNKDITYLHKTLPRLISKRQASEIMGTRTVNTIEPFSELQTKLVAASKLNSTVNIPDIHADARNIIVSDTLVYALHVVKNHQWLAKAPMSPNQAFRLIDHSDPDYFCMDTDQTRLDYPRLKKLMTVIVSSISLLLLSLVVDNQLELVLATISLVPLLLYQIFATRRLFSEVAASALPQYSHLRTSLSLTNLLNLIN